MAKHPNHDLPDRDDVLHVEPPIADERPRRGPQPTPHDEVKATEVPQTRVLLTGDDRTVVTEAYIPTAEYGFRIFVNGQPFEQIGVAADSGTTIFAPTR
jgi:hypothetical protein